MPQLMDHVNYDNTLDEKWMARVRRQGIWDPDVDPLALTGAPSLPMPIELSTEESLAPFFAHLKSNGTLEPATGGTANTEPYYGTKMIEFEKGVLYADGRLDLCKMATGPRNTGALMDSLKPNTFAKHFLLGNNIIGPTGAKAVAAFIEEFPDRFETWYLAGNCIDSACLKLLVNAMITSRSISNIWLKRNPLLSAAAKDVFRLLVRSPLLRTLDLDQTELGDEGVAELFSLLAEHDRPIALRHIYLNATGISAKACRAIASYLRTSYCQLKSLYMSNNPIGSSIDMLAEGVRESRTLQRLSLQSCGLQVKGTTELLHAIEAHPSLEVLDLGQSYATKDLGMRYNWLDDDCADSIISVIRNGRRLKLLNLSYMPMSQAELNDILRAVIDSNSLLWVHAAPLAEGGRTYTEVKAGQDYARLTRLVRERLHRNVAEQYDGLSYEKFDGYHKRFLLSPQDVRFIDSVYRNRDSAAARRGTKRLIKHWNEEDGTLEQVQSGGMD